ETSLTIEGIRIVIDGGLARGPRFDPVTGMTRLVTARVSQAASAQRAGRAGRLEPGIAYRLWPEREQTQLPPYAPPEIREADLAPLLLHPRLAHMALTAKARGQGRLACAIAALLMERDILRTTPQARDADLRLRIELMNERGAARDLPPGLTLDRGGLQRTRDA